MSRVPFSFFRGRVAICFKIQEGAVQTISKEAEQWCVIKKTVMFRSNHEQLNTRPTGGGEFRPLPDLLDS